MCAEATGASCTLSALPVSEVQPPTCSASAGKISSDGRTEIDFCGDDAPGIAVQVVGGSGNSTGYISVDADGLIRSTSFGIPDELNVCCGFTTTFYVFWSDGTVPEFDTNVTDIDSSDCIALSNPITITASRGTQGACCKASVTSFTIADDGATSRTITVGDGQSNEFETTTTSAGDNATYIVTDSDGNITAVSDNGIYNFENATPGQCNIYLLVFDGVLNFAPQEGRNISQLVGQCFVLSDPIIITKETVITPDPDNPPIVNGIPTMGEWLLISFALILMIFGTVAMKEYVVWVPKKN